MIYRGNVWIMGLLLCTMCILGSCSGTKSTARDYTVNKERSRSTIKRKSTGRVAKAKKPVTSKKRKTNTSTRAALSLRNQVIDYTRKHLGTPYNYGGKSPRSGFDCSGLTYHVYRQYGLNIPAGSKAQAQYGRAVRLTEALPGDLMFFGNGGAVNHVALISAMYDEKIMIVHSTSSGGVIEEDFHKSNYWKQRYLFTRSVSKELMTSDMAYRP